MGALPRWLRGSCCRCCPPEAAAPCVLRRGQAGVPSQSIPLVASHCRASLDRSGEGSGLTSRPVIRTPPFAPTWMALSSPCSSMRRSKSGGHVSRTRRPQSGQTHSSVPASAQPLRIISCVSRTEVTIQASRGNLGRVTPANASSSPTQQATPLPGRKRYTAPQPVARVSQSNVDRAQRERPRSRACPGTTGSPAGPSLRGSTSTKTFRQTRSRASAWRIRRVSETTPRQLSVASPVLVRVAAGGRVVVADGVLTLAAACRRGPERASAETECFLLGLTGLASSF